MCLEAAGDCNCVQNKSPRECMIVNAWPVILQIAVVSAIVADNTTVRRAGADAVSWSGTTWHLAWNSAVASRQDDKQIRARTSVKPSFWPFVQLLGGTTDDAANCWWLPSDAVALLTPLSTSVIDDLSLLSVYINVSQLMSHFLVGYSRSYWKNNRGWDAFWDTAYTL